MDSCIRDIVSHIHVIQYLPPMFLPTRLILLLFWQCKEVCQSPLVHRQLAHTATSQWKDNVTITSRW